MLKRILIILTLAATLITCVGCSDETLYGHCELVIPLTDDYYEVSEPNFDISYSNGVYGIAITRISYVAALSSGLPETMTSADFGEYWLKENSRIANIINDEITYTEYSDGEGDEESFYLVAFYRTRYAYFVVMFVADATREDTGRAEFLSFARGITFDYSKAGGV